MITDLSYSIEDRENVKIVNFYSNITVSSSESFEKLIDDFSLNASVILNMEDVHLVTSSGLNSLINVSIEAKEHNTRVLLMKPDRKFRNMVEYMKTYDLFTIIDTVEEGLLKLKYYT